MRKDSFALAALLLSTAAQAAPSVAVSARGADSGSCGDVTAPCRTLQYALNRVDAGGKIDILDSAEYGRLIITKAVNVIYAGRGVALAQALSAGGAAIHINAGANDVVRLQGLTVDGGGAGSVGVNFVAGARLEIEDCAVHNFTGYGVFLRAANASFSIVNSTIGSNGSFGVLAHAPSGAMRGAADKLRLFGNATGGMQVSAAAGATNEVVVTNSVAMSHREGIGAGFRAAGAGAKMTLADTTTMDNLVGAQSAGGATRLSDSILVGNNAAVAKTGGAVETFGNNIFRNGNDALGVLTPVQLR